MKKLVRTLAALTACATLLMSPALAAGFDDVPADAEYAPGVEYCKSAGLLIGTSDTTFSPEDSATRAMLAVALYRRAGSPKVEVENPFPDVDGGSWYGNAVIWAKEQGLMNGYPDGQFRPNDPVSHEQLAVVFWRQAGSPVSEAGDVPEGTSAYAADAMAWYAASGLADGLDEFSPAAPSTRAQLAMALMNRSGSGYTTVSAMDVMCQPTGVAVAEDGSLFVTDTYNKVVWLVKDGESTIYAGGSTVTDLYGQPVGGYNDGAPEESHFRSPWAIAPFLDGWAVSDPENSAVRLVRPDGVETVNGHSSEHLSTSGLGVVFEYPTGLASDDEGNLYVSDTFQDAVRKITPEGEVTTAADGLSEPMGLCWQDGVLYIAESGANRISKLEDGEISVVAGSGEVDLIDGEASQAAFAAPQGVAVGEDGTIYVSDTLNSAIRRIRDGAVDTVLVRDTTDLTSFAPASPANLLVLGDTLYVCDPYARMLLTLSIG